ncbi:MAG: T9SS type A sorting domain-containing protein [Lewinellaceae bacterium]|nr:T9SS type A sorting domain-containing protein [Lewinellaceae bacterium]
MKEPRIYGPYPEHSEARYIKAYINFVNPPGAPWISQAVANASAGKTMEVLNAAFNPHGIHFVGGFSWCRYDTANVFQSGQSVEDIRLEGDSDKVHLDGIDVYVLGNTGAAFGWAYGAPSLYIHTVGIEEGAWANESAVVVHEMGHALGLLHLDESFCDSTVPCPGQEASCNCTGDYVCDTQPIANASIDAGTACSHPSLPESIVRNFMSYTNPRSCRGRFTTEQARRMHAYLASHPLLAPVQIAAPITIPGAAPSSINGDIVVLSGEYTIASPLEMLPGASITVKQGAVLRVKSTVTGACGQMWAGIVVEGSAQSAPNSGYQGKVIISGDGLVENAACGVLLEGEDGSGGGIVEVLGGELRNNRIGIRFASYGFMNASRVLFGSFTIDDDYLGGAAPAFIEMNSIKGLQIRYSSFSDNRASCPSPEALAIGVVAANSGFWCTNSAFERLSAGIYASQFSVDNGVMMVYRNTFAGCLVGLRTSSSSSFLVQKNSFLLNKPSGCTLSGGKIVGAQIVGKSPGFTFSQNTFSQDTFLLEYAAIGSECIGTGEGMGNAIRDNTYENILVGNRASGDNGYAEDGLLYLCNKHLLTVTLEEFAQGNEPKDYEVSLGGTIRKIQGQLNDPFAPVLPTGNEFSATGYTFYNDTLNPVIEYYYDGDSAAQDPFQFFALDPVGILPFAANGYSDYCSSGFPCTPPCSETAIQQVKTDFFQHRQERKATQGALALITGESEREKALDTIYRLRLIMNREASLVLQHYALDTVAVKTDSILRWLELSETFSADYYRARHYFFSGQLAHFDNLWPGLDSHYELTEAGQAEYDSLDILFTLLRPHLEQWAAQAGALPDSILSALTPWTSRCWEPGFLAASLLRRNGLVVEPHCEGGAGQQLRRQRPAAQKLPASKKQEPGDIRLYPNPARSELFLEVPGPAGPAEIRLFNLQGALLKQWRLEGSSPYAVSLNQQNLPSGLYLVEVRTCQGKTFRQKLMLIH